MAGTKGRSAKYSTEELSDMLTEFTKRHRGEKITYKALVEETSIPRHIWNYKFSKIIDNYNANILAIKTKNHGVIEFPTAVEIVNKYENNRKGLINQIQLLLDIAATIDQYQNMQDFVNTEKEKNQQEINELKAELQKKNEELKAITEIMNNFILKSPLESFRKENNISHDCIESSAANFENMKNVIDKFMSL